MAWCLAATPESLRIPATSSLVASRSARSARVVTKSCDGHCACSSSSSASALSCGHGQRKAWLLTGKEHPVRLPAPYWTKSAAPRRTHLQRAVVRKQRQFRPYSRIKIPSQYFGCNVADAQVAFAENTCTYVDPVTRASRPRTSLFAKRRDCVAIAICI